MDTKGTNLISVRLCYFLFHFFFIIPSNAITDTLLQGQQLRSSDQLFSANGYYRLGFFSPRHAVSQHWGTAKFYNFPRQYLGSFYGYEKPYLKIFSSQPDSGYSSRYAEPQYLGIFYNYANEDGQKAVWVANRNTPISDRSGRLVIDEYGNMKILQAGVNPPVVLCSVDGRVNASATLLDTGNFILRELTSDGSTKRILWQSFDYPTDTLLPGMKLGINKTGLTWSLTSWISDDNPASGSFTLGGDPKGTNQLIIYRQGEIYWKSGLWINGKFELVPQLSPDYYHRFSYISNGNEKYFNFSTSKDYAFPRYTIESTGRVSESTGSTIFGACDSSYNPDAGCMKKKLPECRDPNTDFYEKLSFIYSGGVEFDNSHNLSLFDCQAKCLNDCSCVAYASVNEDETGCELWSKVLEIIDASYGDSDPAARSIHVLYKRANATKNLDLKEEDPSTIWIIIAAAGVPVILMIWSLFHLIRRKYGGIDNIKTGLWALASVLKEWGVGVRLVFKYYIANIKRRQEMLISLDKLSRDGKKSPDLRFFSYKSLASATNKFATRNELGKGGFGPVYKGILPNGQEIAIKRLSRNSGQGLTEFKNELTLIARLQHTNLVRLVGCCIQRKEMMLIYEYMPNKSLDFFLFDPIRRTLLDWKKRFEIIQGIAQGLLYLHKYSRLRLIHRDLKAGNILLDDEMNPKISDFGMARIFEQNESKANTDRIVGTYGYMSPEYAMEGICSLKSDVFSFGVLLLEIVSGTKNNSYYQPEQPLNLTGHAWELWREGRYLELMDPTLENSYDNNEVLRCIHVGLLCVQDNPIDRPTMSDVAALISYESIPLAAPKQPAFFIHKSLPGAEIVEQRLEVFSSNRVSITEMAARYAEPQYLGIFYNYANEDGQKAVWVANRNTPISDRSGRLVIDEYGNMKILQDGGNPPVVLCSVQGRVNASATLLDTGNFILRELNSDGSRKRVLWQSFDYPTDTLLPGMKLGINNKTGHTWSLTSWISDDNPAPGSFTLGGDPNGTNQLIIWWQGEIYWKSGLWINGKFQLAPQLSPDYYHRFSFISNDNEKYFNFSMSKDYTFPRYTIESTGRVSEGAGSTILGRVSESAESAGSTIFGACDSSSNPDAGCVKKKWPECRDPNTDFHEQRGFIYGDGLKFDNSHNLSLFDCQAKCLNDCSCVAYASVNEDGTGCELWSKEKEIKIIDAYRDSDHPAARSIHVLDESIAPENAKEVLDLKEDPSAIWPIIAAAAGVPVILMLWSLFHLIQRKYKVIENIKKGLWALASVLKEWAVGVRLVFKYYIANIKRRQEMLISLDKLNRDGKKSPELRFFSYKSLASATNKFATRNELGKGGFGPVYKGILQNGQEIAIKRLARNSGQGLTEFKNELTLIARLQHTNLVRLVGCCIQRKEMMLIYEYMPNKSLDFFLFDSMRRTLLDWTKRFEIIQGIAQGLLYLHKYSRLRLIHRDLKAGNILLDDEMNPKISDFGMARIFEQNESKANTNRIVGTYGYMSPEYAMEGICSLKSDVFSFGVLLLEIVSGTKNNSYYQPEQPLNLTGHAWELWREGRYLELMDPTLENSYDNNEVLRCIHVGLLCVQDNPIDRPTMSDVAALIIYESIPLSAPKQPAFFIHKSLPGAEIVEQRLEVFSSNRASITEMGAR